MMFARLPSQERASWVDEVLQNYLPPSMAVIGNIAAG